MQDRLLICVGDIVTTEDLNLRMIESSAETYHFEGVMTDIGIRYNFPSTLAEYVDKLEKPVEMFIYPGNNLRDPTTVTLDKEKTDSSTTKVLFPYIIRKGELTLKIVYFMRLNLTILKDESCRRTTKSSSNYVLAKCFTIGAILDDYCYIPLPLLKRIK